MSKEDSNISIGVEMVDFLQRQLTNRPKMALEFGTGTGIGTLILTQYCEKVVTIDNDPKWIYFTKQKLALAIDREYDNVIFVIGYDSLPTFDELYDFVFLSDTPDVVEEQRDSLLKYWDRLAKGAIIVFDYTNEKEMQSFVQSTAKEKKCPSMLSATGRGIGVIIK